MDGYRKTVREKIVNCKNCIMDAARKDKVDVALGALLLLVAIAYFGFGLSHEITNLALDAILIGLFFFPMIKSLRAKHYIAAALAFACMMLILATWIL